MAAEEAERARKGTVLVVEDEPSLEEIVHALLADEGYAVSVLGDLRSDAVRAAVGRLEPDCILLDGTGQGDYATAWLDAVWAHTRHRPIPVVMFTAGQEAVLEALAAETERSRAISAVVAKPFDVDVLLDTVARAVGSVPRFDRSERAETARTAAIVAQLEAAGATDVRTSTRREWVNFYVGDTLTLIYWSQRDGVYYVLRQPQDTGALQAVGRFHDLDAAVAAATTAPGA